MGWVNLAWLGLYPNEAHYTIENHNGLADAPMSFQIERGLFSLEFTDHHAILGVPVDAEIKDIRKRYLKIARRLHPDALATETEADKERASQYLAKLVNPAWERLSQEKERNEYTLLLKLKGQQALRQQESVELGSNLAKQLSTASNPDHFYAASLKDLANKQYEHLDQTLEITAQISEMNLVYLMRKESSGGLNLGDNKQKIYTGDNLPDSSQSTAGPPSMQRSKGMAPPAPSPQTRQQILVEQYYRRARALFDKGNYAQAILELRDALKVDASNGRCHSLMGIIYLKQNQGTMAKIHFTQALKHNPQDEDAIAGMKRLGQAVSPKVNAQRSTRATPTGPKNSSKPDKPDDKKGGGGLFGLFGKKK